jgi:hypothetical protein
MYWVGMDTDPRTTPEALAEFNHFYSTVHVHEVVAAHPGFLRAARYERVDSAPHGGVQGGPRWLAVYAMADEASAQQYVKDNERPWLHRRKYSPWPSARRRAKTVWRMVWRQLTSAGWTDGPPQSLLLVGTNAAAPADNIRGLRLELYREFAHPAPGCPRFCDVSAAGASAADAPDTAAETIWRLVYRPIPPPT